MPVGRIGTIVQPESGRLVAAACELGADCIHERAGRLGAGPRQEATPAVDYPCCASAVARQHPEHAADPASLLSREHELLVALVRVEQLPLAILHIALHERLDHRDERRGVRDREQRQAMTRAGRDQLVGDGGHERARPEPDGCGAGASQSVGEHPGEDPAHSQIPALSTTSSPRR